MNGDQQKQGSIVGNKWVQKNELDNYLKCGETNNVIKSFLNNL